jgi:hypothetical protein
MDAHPGWITVIAAGGIMQLGRKLAEGYASDPEADEVEQPVAVIAAAKITAEERSEPDAIELPARV